MANLSPQFSQCSLSSLSWHWKQTCELTGRIGSTSLLPSQSRSWRLDGKGDIRSFLHHSVLEMFRYRRKPTRNCFVVQFSSVSALEWTLPTCIRDRYPCVSCIGDTCEKYVEKFSFSSPTSLFYRKRVAALLDLPLGKLHYILSNVSDSNILNPAYSCWVYDDDRSKTVFRTWNHNVHRRCFLCLRS